MVRGLQESNAVYTINQLRDIVIPIAERFGMKSVAVFGSYARGEADSDSDIDLIMDHGDQLITRIFGVGGEVEALTGKTVDVYSWGELLPGSFQDAVRRDAVML